MKKNKLQKTFFLPLTLILLVFSSCSKDKELIKGTAKYAPFVKFLDAKNYPASSFKGDVTSWSLDATLEAPSSNVRSLDLYIGLGTSTPKKSSISVTSFPGQIKVTGNDVLTTLGLSASDFNKEEKQQVRFYGLVTGNDGVVVKDFPGERNVSNDFYGWSDGTFSAYRFVVTFERN